MAHGESFGAPMQTVMSFATYVDAQRAIEALGRGTFPVDRLAIVGADLRTVERLTGRRAYASTIAYHASSGAGVGAFLGFVLGLFGMVAPLVSALRLAVWGLVLGTLLGVCMGAVIHATLGPRREFSSVARLEARRYELMAPADLADEARRLLSGLARTA